MSRFGNPRFDTAVSTRGTRGWRADHPSSEGIVFTSQIVTRRNAGRCRWAVGATVALLLAATLPYDACAQAPANGATALTPVSLPADPGVPAAAPTVPDTEIKVRLDRSGLAIAGEHLHVGLLRRFYAAKLPFETEEPLALEIMIASRLRWSVAPNPGSMRIASR